MTSEDEKKKKEKETKKKEVDIYKLQTNCPNESDLKSSEVFEKWKFLPVAKVREKLIGTVTQLLSSVVNADILMTPATKFSRARSSNPITDKNPISIIKRRALSSVLHCTDTSPRKISLPPPNRRI